MAKIAPKIPQNFPPIIKEIKTKAGGRPMNLLVKIGVRMLPSICWIIIKANKIRTAIQGDPKAELRQ